MSIPSSADITSLSSTLSDTIATNSSTTTTTTTTTKVTDTAVTTTSTNNLQLQAQQHHQQAVLQQQQRIQRQRLLDQQQQQLQYHLQIQQRQQNNILLKQQQQQQQQQQNSLTPPTHPSSQQDQLPQQRQRNMLQQRIFQQQQQQQGFPLALSISFDQQQQRADQSPKLDGPPPLKRSRMMTMSHSASSTPLTPLSADASMFGMNNTAFNQPLYMDPQHYRQQQQQRYKFAGNDFDWMTAAAVSSELSNSNGGLATPGSTSHSRSVAASGPISDASSLPSPSMTSATTTADSSSSSTATTATPTPVSVVIPSNITTSPLMHLTSSSSSISVSTSDKQSFESSSTTASPEMSEAIIASEDSNSVRKRRTRGSLPLPTPIHPLSTELHHPHAVVPSQNFHKFPPHQQQHHHALATPTSATAPTPPLPLPSSHHHQFQQQQQQQQEDYNGLGLGLGLGLNLGFYDFMPISAQQQQSSTSSISAPSTPNPSASVIGNTVPSPIPKAVMAHFRSSSNNSNPVTSNLPHPHPLGPPVLRSNDDSLSSAASSPSMMDLTGMASGLEAAVVVASHSSLPHIHNSRIIKSMSSSSTASSSASSSGTMTHNSKFANRGSFSASSTQASPDLDAAPHKVGDMEYENGTGSPGAGEDDGQNTNEEDNEENSDDDDDDDDPENNRPAICPHCLKEFQSKGLLRSHIVSHSSDRPFVCRDCSDKSYKRNHDLLRHRREKHNVEGAVIPPRGSGRHSHSGASGSASKRSAGLAGLGGIGGDLMMGGGLVGFVGGLRNRNHRRSCSSAILGSGLGTRSSTTPYSMALGHVHHHHHQGMGLSEQYPPAVTVISQQHQHTQQQQQNKIPSPHDLMFASPNAAAAGMMYLNTNSLLSAVAGGNNASLSARSSPLDPFGGGTGLEFPHLSSMGPPLPLPSQKHQLHLQQQQSQPLSQVFGHHQFTHQQPQTQTQQVHHGHGRRASHQNQQLSQVPPPLQQYHHNQHQHALHPLQHPHPLSLQFQQQQQQQQTMLHQAPRLASQQPPSQGGAMDMNLGLSLGLSGLERSSSTLATSQAEQQRRASAASLSSATSSSLSLSSTAASSVAAETPLQRKRRLSDSDITTTTTTTPTVVTMSMMTSSSTPSTPSLASANDDGSAVTVSSSEYIRDRTVSSPASVLLSQQPPFIPLINQAW
ncbi:hypothetical protein BG015_000761 [Linnemannia schmuckeri]|uniref:C2H2-type domain-containing protein n=1 Tax=Linnemannia schmuckeri TaxID=64567 RepID=A0A9P5RR49_9FUNG|nr:hypothetical protein BG015_000761 [Linnemannia schmuckeri]